MGNTSQHTGGGEAGANQAGNAFPTEIMVEGVGIMRHMSEWQVNRLSRIRGPNRAIAPLAFGLGMTFHQFRSLSQEQKKECEDAFGRLTAPPPMRRQNRFL